MYRRAPAPDEVPMLAGVKSTSKVERANGFSPASSGNATQADAKTGEAIAQGVLCAFDFVRCGAAVVELDGRLLCLNQRAHSYLGDGLILSHGYLSARQREGSDALEALLARLRMPPPGENAGGCTGGIALPRSDARPLVAYAIPWSDIAGDHPQPALAILILVDPNERCEPAAGLLRQIFGLTSAESRVAKQLLQGRGMGEIAASSGVAEATIRTQMKSVLQKTNTHRQSELVMLLGRIARLSISENPCQESVGTASSSNRGMLRHGGRAVSR
jgi:DNA-binding CsgD family transcriptional regulator